jgi:hypothetical protein
MKAQKMPHPKKTRVQELGAKESRIWFPSAEKVCSYLHSRGDMSV